MKLLFILFLLVTIMQASCGQMQNISQDNNGSKYGKYAMQAFLEERSYMSERDALSNEIGWYKEPQIISHCRYPLVDFGIKE